MSFLLVVIACGMATAQPPEVRLYNVQYTGSAPTIDGNIGATEWNAADPAAGDWRLLRQAGTTVDVENSRFRALWDDNNLYILFQSDYGAWLSDIGGMNPAPIDFGADNLNLYFNPDEDGEGNFPAGSGQNMPYTMPDGYQIAFNQYPGQRSCGGDGIPLNMDDCSQDNRAMPTSSITTGSSFGSFAEAHVDTQFGNQAEWAGMRGTHISQNNTSTGGTVEMKIPWSDFDARAMIDDGMGGMKPTGLNRTTHPDNNDAWFINISRISSDAANQLPVWNWTSSQFFAETPHGKFTFVGRPGLDGDFDNDEDYDCDDVNALSGAVATGGSVAMFDLNGDGSLTLADVDAWRAEAGNNNIGAGRVYTIGDANLNGNTDGSDFGIWNAHKFTNDTDYCDGNFNADLVVDGSDFGLWNSAKFTSAAAVPEPVGLATISLALSLAGWRRR